jgi:hypothetical protein
LLGPDVGVRHISEDLLCNAIRLRSKPEGNLLGVEQELSIFRSQCGEDMSECERPITIVRNMSDRL